MNNNIYIVFEDSKKHYVDITSSNDVNDGRAFLEALISYNNISDNKEIMADDLRKMIIELENGNLILAGGLDFVDENGIHIYPGCCCGLESWKNISAALQHRESPWMGHDPFVHLEIRNGQYIISEHSFYNSWPLDENEIEYDKEEFMACLSKLDKEFIDFVNGPLTQALEEIFDENDKGLCEKFIENLIEKYMPESNPYYDFDEFDDIVIEKDDIVISEEDDWIFDEDE